MKTDNSEKKRFIEVDVLRGFAAFSVLLFHYTSIYGKIISFRDQPYFQASYGNVGVHVFFMISGFVIFMTLKRTQHILDFAISRFSRLYPAYWVSLILTTFAVTILNVPVLKVTFTQVIGNITMLPIGYKFVDPVYWTLVVELFFYFAMAIFFLLKALDSLPIIMLVWQVCALVLPAINPITHFDHFIVYNKIHALLNFDFIHLFAMGIVFYLYRSTGRLNKTSFAIIILALIKQSLTNSMEMTLLTVFFAGYFLLMVKGYLRLFNLKPFVFLGTISYPLYLTHRNIGFAIIHHLEKYNINSNLAILIATLAAIILASIITYTVERPAMNAIRAWCGEKVRPQCA